MPLDYWSVTWVNQAALASIVGARTVEEVHRVVADEGGQQRKPGFKTAVEDVTAIATVLALEAESILGRRTARVLGALALFAAVGGLLVWYIAPSSTAQKQALVVTLAQILGGTALLSGLYFTWRTLQVNREGQLTERFTRAIDQLGATDDKTGEPRLELRLGGIYALERIDKESPERAYHRTVMEVLTAYTREDSRRDHRGESSRRSPPADIQAILTVLSRRQHGGVPKDGMAFLDLRGANLEGTNLTGADLEGTNLQGTNLQGAELEGVNLQDARLQEANLRGAYLQVANLQGARLQGADLQEADLRGADLLDAKVTDEQLADTRSLQGATMPDGSKHP
jgi:hypothetical protein